MDNDYIYQVVRRFRVGRRDYRVGDIYDPEDGREADEMMRNGLIVALRIPEADES